MTVIFFFWDLYFGFVEFSKRRTKTKTKSNGAQNSNTHTQASQDLVEDSVVIILLVVDPVSPRTPFIHQREALLLCLER